MSRPFSFKVVNLIDSGQNASLRDWVKTFNSKSSGQLSNVLFIFNLTIHVDLSNNFHPWRLAADASWFIIVIRIFRKQNIRKKI